MTYERLKKIIQNGKYNRDAIMNQLDVFLMNNRITTEQYQELVEHFDSDPQIPQVRIFMNDVSVCLYCYNDKVFITQKPLKSKLP